MGGTCLLVSLSLGFEVSGCAEAAGDSVQGKFRR